MSARAFLVGLLALALIHTGCATGSSGLPNAPVFHTGASATIIPPGQSAPAMPGYGRPSAAAGPGGYGGSYSGSYSGVPGAPGSAGVPPQQGAQLYPTGQPPLGQDMSMLGGAVTVDTRNIRRKHDALWSNPLFWPFAAVAWPFRKLDQAINSERDARFREYALQRIYQQTGVAMPERYPYADGQERQVAHERAQQQAMERQILEQRASDGSQSGLAGSRAIAGAPTASLSIADELEALRSGRVPPAASDAGPASSGAPAPAAPVPGAATADEAEDRDGDGRVDRWVYRQGDRRRELLDEDHDGRPERTVFFEPGSDRVARVDEDANGDGEVDSWTLYQDGQIARRRADSNGDGEPDTWTFYAGGQVARHEEDSDGDGVRDRIEHYENGRLARRSEDADGDGRPERTTRFDEQGRPAALEEDKDGDGQIDVRSHYSGGKLVRRELLDETQALP